MSLRDYMTDAQRNKLDNLKNPDVHPNGVVKTTHSNCLRACGVARPGKTARDNAKRG